MVWAPHAKGFVFELSQLTASLTTGSANHHGAALNSTITWAASDTSPFGFYTTHIPHALWSIKHLKPLGHLQQ